MKEVPSRDKPIHDVLQPGETILWEGQPDRHSFVLSGSWARVALSIVGGMVGMILGGVLFVNTVGTLDEFVSDSSGSNFYGPTRGYALYALVMVLSLALIGTGLNLLVISNLRAYRQAQNTYYAVTNRRVLVQSGKAKHGTEEIDLREISALNVVSTRAGTGTIYFGDAPFTTGFPSWRESYKQLRKPGALRFAYICGAREVHDIIQRARTRAV